MPALTARWLTTRSAISLMRDLQLSETSASHPRVWLKRETRAWHAGLQRDVRLC